MSEKDRLIEMAESSISDAEMVKEDSERLFWNSIYYSLFYVAKAALINRGKEPGSHSGTDSQLAKTFYRDEGELSAKEASFYSDLRRIREEMDYEPYTSVVRDKDETLEKARDLVNKLSGLARN